MQRPTYAGRPSGFTLTEFLVTVAIAAITISIALPSFRTLMTQNTLTVASNKLRTAALAARSAAISHNRRITFCAGVVETGCHGDWTRQEWLVFEDRDRDGIVDADERVHHAERDPASVALSISYNGPFANKVIFTPTGTAVTTTGAFAAGRIRVCTELGGSGHTTELVLIGSGRLESEHKTLSGGCAPL